VFFTDEFGTFSLRISLDRPLIEQDRERENGSDFGD
jgi:hypothetical protein